MENFLGNIGLIEMGSTVGRRAQPPLSNLHEQFAGISTTGTISFIEAPSLLNWEMSTTPTKTELAIPREELKKAIVDLFQMSTVLYASDIVYSLRADYDLVAEIIHELEKEGAVRPGP